MPELPEAETIARGMRRRIMGRQIERATVHRSEAVEPMTTTAFERGLQDRQVTDVGRRGKWIIVRLDNQDWWVTQLRMTGRFSWGPPGAGTDHLSVTVRFASPSDSLLRFHDVRRFGRMWLLDTRSWQELEDRLGPEPLSRAFTVETLAERLDTRTPLRNALLDQRRIAGIGNIYANEACHVARLDPRRPGRELDSDELERLHRAIREVLTDAVRRRGTSLSDYLDIGGEEGGFQEKLAVYGRHGEPCPRCKAPIERARLANRSAYYCPSCQD